MDRLVTLHHGGSVKVDDYGFVEFDGMQRVSMLFRSRPSLGQLDARLRERLKWDGNEVDVVIEGVLDVGSNSRIKRLVSIGCEDEWEDYVSMVMDSEVKSIDLFARKLSRDPTPHGMSLDLSNSTRFTPLVSNREIEVEKVPDVVSAPFEIQFSQPVQGDCQNDDGGSATLEIPLSQTDPGDFPANVGDGRIDGFAPVAPFVIVQPVCRASNSVNVQIVDDVEPYRVARAVDSDDDRPVGELTTSDTELLRRVLPDRDPLLSDFNDLSDAHMAWAQGRDDELLDMLDLEASMIQKGLVFETLSALKLRMKDYSVKYNRPFKVRHSYKERRYTVVCDKEGCDWRVCSRKQKGTEKFKITRVTGPHNCRSTQLNQKHRQLTSTFIATRLLDIVKSQPTLRVRTMIRLVQNKWGYKIKYGTAWRAKQRAIKMVYGDWEEAYEQLPALLNAIKAVNPGMHYEYVPKPNAWKDGRQIFYRAFWCFPQCVEAFKHCRPVLSIDGTFLLGKYQGTLLIAIGVDADNALVPLAFALVEKERKESWGWFLRLVRIHVVGPEREVCVISDRHADILSAIQDQIPGHAPVHHRWCTRHLAEDLICKDGSKDTFPLFEEVARQLVVKNFESKLKNLKTATNAEGRDWLRGLMGDVDKWTRAHDKGGWRYEFQTSNMVELFNGLLKGIRGMPVTAIVAFTFYKLVAWFNERHAAALELQSRMQEWAPRPQGFLDKAIALSLLHEINCFDHATDTYEIIENGGTTIDDEGCLSQKHKVVLTEFSCTCRKPQQFHFPCSHYVTACNARNLAYESKIPREFSVASLVLTWAPRFEPYRDEGEWPPYSGLRYIADPDSRWNERGSRKRSRHKMVMDQIPGKLQRGRANPFATDPEQHECRKCGKLGHNSRTCHWQPGQDVAIPPAGPVL